MNIKHSLTAGLVYIAFIAVIGGIAYYSWVYFRNSNKADKNKSPSTPSVQTEDNNNGASTTDQSKTKSLDSLGISSGPTNTNKPKVAGTSTTSNVTQTTEQISEEPTFTLSKPKVDYVDDNYVSYKYTFKLNQEAYNELKEGFRYKINEDSCENYFDEDKEVFDREWDNVGTTVTFKFELPEEVLEDDYEDDDYMKKTSYTIYGSDGDVKFTGTTWAPVCKD